MVAAVLNFLVYWWIIAGGLSILAIATFYIYKAIKNRKKGK